MEKFIGRDQELKALRRELDAARPSLVIVLGRRRVGKSRLLIEALKRRQGIYYQATKVTASESLQLFKAEVAKSLGSDPLLVALSDWQGTLTYLARLASANEGITIVLDEFPYLCETDNSLPSVFQKFWDQVRTSKTQINLILCGSKVSFMESLLAEKNPLHGRQSLKLDVAPLPYRDATQFLSKWSKVDRLLAYGVFGGNPFYLSQCDPTADLKTNVINLVLAKGAPFADEPVNLLQAELRDVARYATLLRAIADGCTDSGKIIGRVKEMSSASTLAPYIERLAELRFIRIVRSMDASERERDRRYYIDDPFLAFWYRFFLPNASAIAAGHADQVYNHAIKPQLDDYMGDLFEWICRDHARLYLQDTTSTAARVIGQIWASDYDIDVAGALLDGSMVYGECKWWRDPVGGNILDHLVACTGRTGYGKAERRRHYLLYSKSGFTPDLKKRAKADPSIHLFAPSTLL
jgi:AAA+ ATPase superfamily predicted ATPase